MLFHLPTIWTVVIDIIAWLIIHMSVSYSISKIPADSFKTETWLYKKRAAEQDGLLYEKQFFINNWKSWLPDGAALFKQGFQKKHLSSRIDADYIKIFLQETCRAEITHWIVFLFSPFFFIWNFWYIGIVMIVYAFFANIPCVLAQRYNRIRLQNLLLEINTSS